MTCRHKPGDPNCTSGNHPDFLRNKAMRDYQRWVIGNPTNPGDPLQHKDPDNREYTILDAEERGPHLVLKVEYPSCPRCTFEGVKVIVFPNCTLKDAILWKQIDPHFREQALDVLRVAPSPAARFPATDEGWRDALQYATSIGVSC